MAWNVYYYETQSGQKVVKKLIDSLQVNTQAKLAVRLDLLTEYGNQLGMPHSKAMGGGLYELRVRGQQEIRIFYVFAPDQQIHLLHAFMKKSQTTHGKDLSVARVRQIEITAR